MKKFYVTLGTTFIVEAETENEAFALAKTNINKESWEQAEFDVIDWWLTLEEDEETN